MTWTCTFKNFNSIPKREELKVGDLFFATENKLFMKFWPFCYAQEDLLSQYYKDTTPIRRPLLIVLPGKEVFCVDAKNFCKFGLYGGWQVTGEIPRITVEGVITLENNYTGTIRDGIIADDFLNRSYDKNGDRLFGGQS